MSKWTKIMDRKPQTIICVDCGKKFTGMKPAKRCPECKKKRIAEKNRIYMRGYMQRRKLQQNQPGEKICVDCGKKFPVSKNGITRKRCQECQKRHLLEYQKQYRKRKRKEPEEIFTTCVYCGEEFSYMSANGNTRMYCDKCIEAAKREHQANHFTVRRERGSSTERIDRRALEARRNRTTYGKIVAAEMRYEG